MLDRRAIDEPIIKMSELKPGLRNLEELMPNHPHPLVYEFGKYMDRMSEDGRELNRAGINIRFMYAVKGLRRGLCEFTKKPISGALAGHEPEVYGRLLLELPAIYDAVIPDETMRTEAKELFYVYLVS